MAEQGHCSLCKAPYQVVCPAHPDMGDQVTMEKQCFFKCCSPEKHIVIPCACDPDLWDVNELLNPDAECCTTGVCARHEECERHGHCPDPAKKQQPVEPSAPLDDDDDGNRCPYEYVGQCTSFFIGPNGERARCSESLDGVADSQVCPGCVRRYYPRPICEECGEGQRSYYESMSGAWLRLCRCCRYKEDGDYSASSSSPPEEKKQKTE